MQRLQSAVLVCAFFGSLCAIQAESIKVHKVQPGETLPKLAEQFLGGSEYAEELLEFNKLKSTNKIQPNFLLAIPGTERDDAIKAIEEAQVSLDQALEAKADKFAKDEFSLAEETVTGANEARTMAAYDKAAAVAHLGKLRAEQALEAANRNAVVQQDAKVLEVHGQVEVFSDQAEGWKAAEAGSVLPVAGKIRTAAESRAEIQLADKSIIRLVENSEFEIHNFQYDRRDGRRESAVNVKLGNMLGHITPREMEESTFDIYGGGTAIAIRGTVLRTSLDEEGTTRMSVLEGLTTLKAKGSREVVEVPENYGALVEKGKLAMDPVKLLPPPNVKFPTKNKHKTAVQRVQFVWNLEDERKAREYHLEIAKDKDFNQIVQNHFPRTQRWESDVLPEGKYYWRLASVDGNGLEGNMTEPRTLHIAKNLDVEILPSFPPLKKTNAAVTGPHNTFSVEPPQADTSVVAYEYKIDDGEFEPLSGGIQLADAGEHVILVRGVCAEGTYGETQKLSVSIDSRPPQVAMVMSPVKYDNDLGSIVTVSLQASDNTDVDRIEYSLDGSNYQRYEDDLVFTTDRSAELQYRAVDVVGNISHPQRVQIFGDLVPYESQPEREIPRLP